MNMKRLIVTGVALATIFVAAILLSSSANTMAQESPSNPPVVCECGCMIENCTCEF